MTVLEVILLSIVEGITEFLPVSSTFHLLVTQRLLGIPSTDFVKVFEVVIQVGAIGAVALLYGREVWNQKKLLIFLLLSFFPIAFAGIILKDFIKEVLFDSFYLTTVIFILVGVIFLGVEYLVRAKRLTLTRTISTITPKQALLVGLFQMLALMPGVSRAGAVIVGMMILGYKREEAAKYSFLLSVPTIGAAGAYDVFHSREILMQETGQWLLLVGGVICSFFVALLVVRTLLTYLTRHSLAVFGWYRIIGGIILLVFLSQ